MPALVDRPKYVKRQTRSGMSNAVSVESSRTIVVSDSLKYYGADLGTLPYICQWDPSQGLGLIFPLFWKMLWSSLSTVLFISAAVSQGVANFSSSYNSNAETAFDTLQQWYNNDTGLYDTAGWWNSANCLTTIGAFAVNVPSVKSQVSSVLANSYIAAQATNLQTTKVILSNYNMQSFNGSDVPAGVIPVTAANPIGFLNDYYDDEGWWALNWIQAYDLTGQPDYLTSAMDIFEDMKNASTTPCGGIWWDKEHTYVNAIANELYLSVASHLANRVPQSKKDYYLSTATFQLAWFQSSGMVNAANTINDGLDLETCQSNGGTVWSYNHGVIVGALVELQKATPASTAYLTLASTLANAYISSLPDSSILTDPCEPDCGPDGSQFKGVFMRNLQLLQQAQPESVFLKFVGNNADSVWKNDRDYATGQLGIQWGGPFIDPATASTHSSAFDALVAADALSASGMN